MFRLSMIFAAGALAAMVGQATAQNVTQRGPLPFNVWDINNDGYISQEEFNTIRQKRQAARAAEGRMMRNQASAPSFASFDKNGDGKISLEEFMAQRQQMMRQRPRGMGGMGMGPGRGMGRRIQPQ